MTLSGISHCLWLIPSYITLIQVDKDLRVMLIKSNAPAPRVVGVRVWPRAIPQFNVGHLDQLDKAKASLSKAGWDNFVLGGNYVSGEDRRLWSLAEAVFFIHRSTVDLWISQYA